MDDMITPIVVRGSMAEGTGAGCAMNVISWIQGDAHITDFPSCSYRPLASIVQVTNDRLATIRGTGVRITPTLHRKALTAEDSMAMIDLGIKTMGTSAATDEQITEWIDALYGMISDEYQDKIHSVISGVPRLISTLDMSRQLFPVTAAMSVQHFIGDLIQSYIVYSNEPSIMIEKADRVIQLFRDVMGMDDLDPYVTNGELDDALAKMAVVK